MADPTANASAQAKKALQAFFDAAVCQDDSAMRARVTRRTLESGDLDGTSAPEAMNFVVDEPRMEGQRMVIDVRGFLIGAPEGAGPAMELPCLMVLEDGQWKFDLAATGERMTAGG
jgi:hypothetical protein